MNISQKSANTKHELKQTIVNIKRIISSRKNTTETMNRNKMTLQKYASTYFLPTSNNARSYTHLFLRFLISARVHEETHADRLTTPSGPYQCRVAVLRVSAIVPPRISNHTVKQQHTEHRPRVDTTIEEYMHARNEMIDNTRMIHEKNEKNERLIRRIQLNSYKYMEYIV